MNGVTHQIGTLHTSLWALLVAMGLSLLVGQTSISAATLDISLYSQTLPPSVSDTVRLRAISSDEPVPVTYQTITANLVIDGFDIQWDIISNFTGRGGLAVQTNIDERKIIGILPAGTYNVTATWARYRFTYLGQPDQAMLDYLLMTNTPASEPRTGTFQFTVVPEPATIALVASGMCLCGIRRRR